MHQNVPAGFLARYMQAAPVTLGASKQQRMGSTESWKAEEEPAGNNNTAGGY